MNISTDTLTFAGVVLIWPLWLIWEIILLIWRGKGWDVDTISMVAKDRALQLSSLPFIWGGMAGHWWFTWKVPWTYSPVPPITFWALVVGCLVWDILLWSTPYGSLPWALRLVRWPGMMLFLGLLAGAFLFPQRGNVSQPF